MRKRSWFGWLELILSILLMVLGIFTLVNPGFLLTGMVFAYGIAAILMGVADIILYIEIERYVGFKPMISLVSGILSVMSGVMLLVYPGAGALVLTLLFPIWFIAHCISRLSHARHIRLIAGDRMYVITVINHILGLVLGVMMLFNPLFTLTAIRCFAGIYLLLLGIDSLFMAISGMGMRR